MLRSNDAKLKQFLSKQASPPADVATPGANMLQAFLRDLQQQRRPARQVRRNQATETRGDVPGPRLAALLHGTSGAGGDLNKIPPPVGATLIRAQVPTKASTEGPETSSVDSAMSPRPLISARSPLLLAPARKAREPSERLLTLAQPRMRVEPPGPLRPLQLQPEDKLVVALERIRTRQRLAEASHCQRAGSEHSSAGAGSRAGFPQARMSPVSSFGAKASFRAQPAGFGMDRERRSIVGSLQGTDASYTDGDWSPRVALRPRRSAGVQKNRLPYSRRKLREPSQRILMLAQPRKTPQWPGEVPDPKRKNMSESGSERASVVDKSATPEQRVRMRQSKAEAAHFGRATERAKQASRWRHAKEEQAAAEAAAAFRSKNRYLGRARSFAVPRLPARKALPAVASQRRP